MLTLAMLSTFTKEAAHPIAHLSGAVVGGGLAAYGVAPYLLREEHEDLMKLREGEMPADTFWRRTGVRALEGSTALGLGVGAGAASPYALRAAGYAAQLLGIPSAPRLSRRVGQGIGAGLVDAANSQQAHAAVRGLVDEINPVARLRNWLHGG